MTQIIYPMFTLVLLSVVIGIILGITRLTSVINREVKPSYFKTFTGESPSERQLKLTRNFNNLFEVPLLFYIVCVLILVLNIQSPLLLTLAWLYVFLRMIHSYIHITYNTPMHRLIVFVLSTIVVLAMWVIVICNMS